MENKIPYKDTASDAYNKIIEALHQAILQLPQSIQNKYKIAANHSPSPWQDIHHWYYGQEDHNLEVAMLIMDILLLSNARGHLHTLLMPKPQGEPDLTLRTVRRTP